MVESATPIGVRNSGVRDTDSCWTGGVCNTFFVLQIAASSLHEATQTITRHLRQRRCLQRSTETKDAGYRPSALENLVDDSGGTGGAVLKEIPLKREGERLIAHDAWRKEERFRRATADRSPAQATERGAGGDQRSTCYAAWDSHKACHTSWAERRRLPPRQEGFRRARHSYLVTCASRNPSCRG